MARLTREPTPWEHMFPRLEYIATISFPEFATYYGIDEGLMGFRDRPLAGHPGADRELHHYGPPRRHRCQLGIGLGVGIGLLVGWSRWARDLIRAAGTTAADDPDSRPDPALHVLVRGTRDWILIYITFAVFAMMIINTLEAIRQRPAPLYPITPAAWEPRAGRSTAPSWCRRSCRRSPAASRSSLASRWAIALAGELLATDSGLGWLMILSERYLMTGRMVVIVVHLRCLLPHREQALPLGFGLLVAMGAAS